MLLRTLWAKTPPTRTFIVLSVFALSFISSPLSDPPAPNVNTELHFSEGSGTSTADASGNGHNATLVNGATWTAGKYGQAVNLDGTNDYLSIPDHADYTLDPTQSYSWSGWVKCNLREWSTVWSQTIDANNYFYFYAHSSSDPDAGPVTNGISVFWWNGTNRVAIHSTNNVLTSGLWGYVTVTYNGALAQASRFTILVNGVDVTNRTDVVSSGTLTSLNPTNIRLGANAPYGDYMSGAIDEARFYRRLITGSEILADMNAGSTDAVPPTISVVAPPPGNVSGTVTISANASDNIGVAGVQFRLDGVNFGTEDQTAPFSTAWNTITTTNGTHSITAIARDAAGNTTTSAPITVTVSNDTQAPTVALTAPAAGTVTGTINVSANASDNVAVSGVQFLLDGVNLGAEDLSAPFQISWNTTTVSTGNHSLTARARDAAGNTTTSAAVTVNVNNDSQSPTVSLTAPAAGTIAGTINVTANATDNVGVVGVQFLLDGSSLSTEDPTAPYSISWNTTTVTNGNHTLTARARDAAGNTTTSSSLIVNINNTTPDVQAPTVAITGPSAGNINGTVVVSANAIDNVGVAGVQFLLDGVNLNTEDLAAPFSISWNTTTATNGAHTISAIARDAAGNTTTSATVSVNINNGDVTAPAVNITVPVPGEVMGVANVIANATDNTGVVGVQFLLNGANLDVEDLIAPYSILWNTVALANGNYTLTARARDAAGNTTLSVPVLVTINNIDNEAPTVSITSPSAGNVTGTINVSATATDNASVSGVQFLLDGVNLGAEDLTSPYSVSWNTSTATAGNHSLTARARDAAGNITTSAAVAVNITAIPTNVLTALNFNEGAGTNTIDYSGRNHPGTLTNAPTWGAGKYGQAVILDGSNDYVNIADHADYTLNPAQSYTWSMWVKNTSFREWSTVWSQTLSTSNFFYFYAHTSTDAESGPVTNGVSVHWYSGSNKISLHSNNNVLTANQWSNITITYNGTLAQASRFTIYVNGVDVTNRTDVVSSGTIATLDPSAIRIGSNQAFGEYLPGSIDEVRYYNRLLSVAEIQTDMNTPIGTDNTAPTVTVTAPANGTTIAGTLNLTANASDNLGVSGVQFLVDGVNAGAEDLAAPYSVSWNSSTVSNGSHVITARARDGSGNTTTSTNVTVTVNNDITLPTVAISQPAAGTVNGTINVTATASDNIGVVGVQFLLNGANLSTEDLTAPYSISWNTTSLTDGSYTLTARARDAAGNLQTSAAVTVNILNNVPDTQNPSVIFTNPPGANVSGTVNLTVNASDNIGVVGVQFQINGAPLNAEDLTAPYTLTWNTTTVANGTYTITARARDAAGNSGITTDLALTVGNAPDTQDPTVTITSPSAGNVSGTINLSANATDNIGVIGVQFLVDGDNVGAEDLTAPYSISLNTSVIGLGAHTISAIARDGAGNTTTSAVVNINVVVGNPPVITAPSATGINTNSATILWTTNIPSNSQVSYGTTTSYGLTTLVDPNLISSHSLVLQTLTPGTLYHYRVISADANGASTMSNDLTFTTSNTTNIGVLNGHNVRADAGKIVPWTTNPAEGYITVCTLAWNYLMNTVPNDPSTGKPAYYSRSYIDPNTQRVVDWPHNPAGLYGMLIESAVKYYQFTNNTSVMQLANDIATWHLDHGMTLANDNWPSVPYSSGDAGSLNYQGAAYGQFGGQGDGVGYLEPDKIGELALGWLQLYRYNGNVRYRDAAIQAGTVLSQKIRPGTVNQSPWPYRVSAKNGSIREEYCSNIMGPIALLDGLIESKLGDTVLYKAARTTAWNWMMTYPMVNNAWAQYFEDVPIQNTYNANLNQLNAMQVARYILEHPGSDPNWEAHVRGLITWVENIFGQSSFGATSIREQTPVFPYPMASHTSRYASVCALLYERTGDLTMKDKAYRSFNWSTYMCRPTGIVIDGPDVGNQWFTDGYGDFVRHFITGMGAVPEWSPANQTHILRTSSLAKNIVYGTNSLSYTSYDPNAREVIHVNFTPTRVTADGVDLPKRTDLNQPGWTLDVATKTLRIYHVGATNINVTSEVGAGRSSETIELITYNRQNRMR